MPEIHLSLRRTSQLSAIVMLAAVLLNASAASAQPSLGSAQNFAVLGATTVTNTGATVNTGDVGVSPGTAITGFLLTNRIAGPGTVTPGLGLVNGTIRPGGMVAAQAHADATVAYAALKGMTCQPNNNLSGQVLGTAVASLPPGVYCFDSSAQLTGTLTLSGSGPWIFQIGSTLTTASNSAVVVAGANCPGSNLFWQVGSSATLGTGTQFAGNILALTSDTVTTGVSVSGSVMALTGAVTLDTNMVSTCAGAVIPPPVDKCDDDRHHHHHHHGDGHDDDDNDRDHHHDDNDHHDHDKDDHDKDHHKDKDHKDKDHKDKDDKDYGSKSNKRW